MKGPQIAIYPGSFDPITNGHIDIIVRAMFFFEKLILLIASAPHKQALFSLKERKDMLQEVKAELQDQSGIKNCNLEVEVCEGLLMDYAKTKNVRAVVRGLRAIADFEYEFQMAAINKRLFPECETIFIMTGEPYYYLSSSSVKEVASLGGNVEGLVPHCVTKRLQSKFRP